jgi:hypothetical protein
MADAAEMGQSTKRADAASGARPPNNAATGAVIADIDSEDDPDAVVVHTAIEVARHEGRRLVFVERSGEGLLGNTFYDDMRGDDAFKPRKDQVFGPDIARREGRDNLARHIEAAHAAGVDAGGWFPTDAGLDGIRAAVERFDGRVIVVPGSVRHPGISDRLLGTTVDDLRKLGARLVFVD